MSYLDCYSRGQFDAPHEVVNNKNNKKTQTINRRELCLIATKALLTPPSQKSTTPPPPKEEYNAETVPKDLAMQKTLTLYKSKAATTEQESWTATTKARTGCHSRLSNNGASVS
jgi:hypothetical protein